MTTHVKRDPFARLTIGRRVVHNGSCCEWCGGKRHRRGAIVDGLFQYGVEHDGGRSHWEEEAFCSKSCHDSYAG